VVFANSICFVWFQWQIGRAIKAPIPQRHLFLDTTTGKAVTREEKEIAEKADREAEENGGGAGQHSGDGDSGADGDGGGVVGVGGGRNGRPTRDLSTRFRPHPGEVGSPVALHELRRSADGGKIDYEQLLSPDHHAKIIALRDTGHREHLERYVDKFVERMPVQSGSVEERGECYGSPACGIEYLVCVCNLGNL
jgi:hypothetical protein